MANYIYNPVEKTLGEFLKNNYPDFVAYGGNAPLDTDISHGIEVEYRGKGAYNRNEHLSVYPFVLWTDGMYKPCHYWGSEHYLYLTKE